MYFWKIIYYFRSLFVYHKAPLSEAKKEWDEVKIKNLLKEERDKNKKSEEKSEGLRRITTLRGGLAIKLAKKLGFKLLIKKAEVDDRFQVKSKILRNRITGKTIVLNDYRMDDYSDLEYKTLKNWSYINPSEFFSPEAAYIIPISLKVGERVLITDLIENYVSGSWNQGDVYRLSKSEAVWNGKDFKIDYVSYSIGHFIG